MDPRLLAENLGTANFSPTQSTERPGTSTDMLEMAPISNPYSKHQSKWLVFTPHKFWNLHFLKRIHLTNFNSTWSRIKFDPVISTAQFFTKNRILERLYNCKVKWAEIPSPCTRKRGTIGKFSVTEGRWRLFSEELGPSRLSSSGLTSLFVQMVFMKLRGNPSRIVFPRWASLGFSAYTIMLLVS